MVLSLLPCIQHIQKINYLVPELYELATVGSYVWSPHTTLSKPKPRATAAVSCFRATRGFIAASALILLHAVELS